MTRGRRYCSTWPCWSRSCPARTTSSTSVAGSRRRASGSLANGALCGQALDELLARGAAHVERAVERLAVDGEHGEQHVHSADQLRAATDRETRGGASHL